MGWPICTARFESLTIGMLLLVCHIHSAVPSAVLPWAGFWVVQVVAEYIMVVDPSHGMLEGSAAAGSGRAAGSAPRKTTDRGPRSAEQPLRLYNEGHPPHAIAQMLVSSSSA